jgi:hypothetical protein
VNVKIADRIKTAVIVVTALIMGYALFVSRDHITYVAHLIHLTGYQAETLFVFIDLPAMIGKVLQLKYFAVSTHKIGRKLMVATGTLSLVCNIVAGLFGGGYGPAGYGAFIVVMFVVLENVIVKIKPAAAVTRRKNADAAVKTPKSPNPKRSAAARKGAETRRRNAVAPVSPGAPSVPAPSVAYMETIGQ